MIAELNQAMAARKHAMAFHSRHGIKQIDKIEPHKLDWAELNEIQKDAAKEARAMLDKIETGSGDVESLELAHEAFMGLHDAIRYEKDQRTETGSREPRAHGGSANRPGVQTGVVYTNGDTGESADTVYALEPAQRFSTWAQERSGLKEDYRTLGLGKYLRAMVAGGKTDIELRALAEGTDSAGGYTVPTALSAQLIDLARAQSVVVRAGARSVPLTSDSNTIARLASDPVPAWRLEAGAVAESDPTFDLVTLTPRSLAVFTKVSVELMEDSLNLATELPRVLTAAMAVELDRVALLGTGTAPEPRGISATSGIGTYAQNALIADYTALSRARTGVLTANYQPSAYVMHPRDEGSFTDLVDSTGQPLIAPRSIAAIPMLTTTSIPVNGGTGTDESTIFCGDFSKLLIGIRSDIKIEILKTSVYGSNLQLVVLAHMRADVAVTNPGAFYTLTGVGRAP